MKKRLICATLFALILGVVIAEDLSAQKRYTLEGRRAIIDDSARITGTLVVTGTETHYGAITNNGAVTNSANVTTNATKVVQQLALTGSTTLAVPSALTGVDTLALGTTKYTWIKIRGASGATDSVTTITGGVSGAIYLFSAVADDTTIVLIDGSNLKLTGNITLDALTDRVLLQYDGTDYIMVAGAAGND